MEGAELDDFDPTEDIIPDDTAESSFSTDPLLPDVSDLNPPAMSVLEHNRIKLGIDSLMKKWGRSIRLDYSKLRYENKKLYYMKGSVKIPLQDNQGKYHSESTFKSKLGVGAARIFREDFGQPSTSGVDTGASGLPSTSGAGLPQREIEGIDKDLQTKEGQLSAQATKLSTDNNRLEELTRTKDTRGLNESEQKEFDELPDKIKANEELIADIKGEIANKLPTIRDIVNSDTTVGEKLKMIFRDYDVTITSILASIGLLIGLIVEAIKKPFTPSPSPSPSPPSQPSNNSVKKVLNQLADWMKNLAGKAIDALPRVIGSILS